MMRKLPALLVTLLMPFLTYAQFDFVEVGINGLTCSMCSYSVENSLRKIPEVDKIQMDLNNNIALIHYKRNSTVNFNLLAERVRNSGFSVRHISFVLSKPVSVTESGVFESGNQTFLCVNNVPPLLSAGSKLKLMGKEFMSKTEYKQVQGVLKPLKKENNGQDILLVSHEK